MTTTDGAERDLRLTVLNPGGAIRNRTSRQASTGLTNTRHAPVNFHGYAACTGGAFQRDVKRAVATGRPVLLLLAAISRRRRARSVALKQHRFQSSFL